MKQPKAGSRPHQATGTYGYLVLQDTTGWYVARRIGDCVQKVSEYFTREQEAEADARRRQKMEGEIL